MLAMQPATDPDHLRRRHSGQRREADAAMAFLKFFSSDVAAPVIKQKGLNPI
jgi:hypothetical protein